MWLLCHDFDLICDHFNFLTLQILLLSKIQKIVDIFYIWTEKICKMDGSDYTIISHTQYSLQQSTNLANV